MIGIYKITSPNNRIYIGQSINIEERWYFHKLKNCKKLTKLNRSFNKYGVENHVFEIIEECDIELLNERERYYQDLYDCVNKGLNCILTKSKDRSGKLSEETKLKISKSRKGKYIKEHNSFYGKKHSQETINKLKSYSGINSKHYGKKDSKETILKKSIAQLRGKGSSAKKVIDIFTLKQYDCLKDAAEDLNVNYSTLKTWMRGPVNKNKTNIRYMKKQLIAVYGSLLSQMYNHDLLKTSELLGTFKTEPVYNLYSLGSFPALKTNGNTSVTMEVYAVDDTVAARVDRLEGYTPGGNNTFYDKIPIKTPYGEASVYIYVNDIPQERLVESGDWKAFKQSYFSPTMN